MEIVNITEIKRPAYTFLPPPATRYRETGVATAFATPSPHETKRLRF
eukprot:CAMPEP_0115319846 /NCGR_PEP_ID=MMETSP0270-20121206/79997_1 /TAXON_ID=71861 /ORGANISM="Scrippsiella trochoidea, Strain CCMP3099" /LENGTH=46 /DNA_ID= /DNA_START= /DNA_END= /DNA_ORIENTATION=